MDNLHSLILHSPYIFAWNVVTGLLAAVCLYCMTRSLPAFLEVFSLSAALGYVFPISINPNHQHYCKMLMVGVSQHIARRQSSGGFFVF